MSRTALVVVVGAAGFLGGAGCGPGASGDYTKPYSAPRPEHPAMTGEVTRRAGASSLAPHGGGSQLPADHPPIGGPSAPGGEPEPDRSGEEALPQGGPMEVLGLTFDVPEGWIRQKPSNRMRQAQFGLPRAEGDSQDGVLTVIAALGSVEDNIERWKGQFQGTPESQVEKRQVAGLEVTVASIEGTFLVKERAMAPGPGTPRPGYTVYGAVVQAPGGQLFFKGWGPTATMNRWRDGFEKMVGSFRTGN